ncbi:hypothetical protein JKF63_01312 [Porcisia hertigi]|uniref:Guanine nucleotide-binding protein subunit beta-like protein n=1 Tax=Porcisia hertigi TaxID=2761500 RepID=A0A836H305_9TRYP|nr:hypothetical protein JKF63_01312 [Porcisia hertigi]
MYRAQEVSLPQLAIVLGNEVSLTALQREWAAYPEGASYSEFRQLLEPHIKVQSSRNSSVRRSIPFLNPQSAPQDCDPGSARIGSIVRVASSSQLVSGVPASVTRAGSDYTGTNRETERARRVQSRQELAGVTADCVDPIKHLFNHVDILNQQRVTWENLVNYLVGEAIADRVGTRFITPFNQFTFSRMVRCLPKQLPHQRKRKSNADSEARKFKRYYRDVKDVSRATTAGARQAGDAGRSRAEVVIREDESLALIRFLDGLPGHKSLFFVSARSCPFMLYSKVTLQRVYSAPPEMFPGVTPSIVVYLEGCDLLVCYSSDDRLLRGLFSLLSDVVTISKVTPLFLEGLVRRVQTMPRDSPTYADYTSTVFVGDSFGQVLRLTAPHGRNSGREFTIVKTYPNLHTRESGGLVDFCVYGAYLYSSGFDGRLLATSLITGQSNELGSLTNDHLTTLVYLPAYDWIVGATSCGRHLLCWEAHSHGTLPGTPFDAAGHGEHDACIIALLYLGAIDQLVSADTNGVVKIWDVSSQECVQSFRGCRVPQLHDGSVVTSSSSSQTAVSSSTRTAASGGGGASSSSVAGRFVNLGLLALLPAGVGQAGHAGGPQCHSLIYCESTQELLCGFTDSITCWSLNSRTKAHMRDAEEVCGNVLYDIRTRTFLVQGATRLSVWDGVHGHRRGVLSQVAQSSLSQEETDIKAVCIDELGSRVFISRGDGCVVLYSTQDLASNASQCTSAMAALWWKAKSSGAGAEAGESVCVHQMHFSSISRTWVAITSNGMLLVRSEGDHREVVFSTNIAVSTSPLTQLRVAEDLGLVAVADAQCTVHIFDMQVWLNPPVTKALARFGGLVDLLFLDHAPGLVTVHAGGVCRCWSCAPAVEHFRLLSVFFHPQHPDPEDVRMAMVEAEHATLALHDRAHLPALAPARGRQQLQRCVLSPLCNTGGAPNDSCDPLQATSMSGSPFKSTLSKAFSLSRTASSLMLSPQGAARRASQRGESTEPRPGLGFERLSPDQVMATDDSTSGLAKLGKSAGVSITNPPHAGTAPVENGTFSAAAMTTESASVEFTSAAYDGRHHHLFLGDSEGVVHTYCMCPLLKAYKLPRCHHASRPAFSLADVIKSTGANPAKCATGPELVRSVRLHAEKGETGEPNLAARSALTCSQPMSTAAQRGRHQLGVMCTRWIDDRGVLAASTYDHEVWFLDGSSGERVARLSTERPPPRLDRPERVPMALRNHGDSVMQEAMAPSGVVYRPRIDGNRASARRNTFTLPQLPCYGDMSNDLAAALPVGASPPCCCTHRESDKGADTTEDGVEGVSLVSRKKDTSNNLTHSSDTRPEAVPLRQTVSFLREADRSDSTLSIHSVLGAAVTMKPDRATGRLKDYMDGSRILRGGEGGASANSSVRLSSRPSSQHKALADDACRGSEHQLAHSNSSYILPPLEASVVMNSASGAQVHMAEWQKRHLNVMREARGIKEEEPVPPGSPNTLIHMEESKGHDADATGQPVLYEPTEGVSPVARSAAITVVAAEVTEALESPRNVMSAWDSSGGRATIPNPDRVRGEKARITSEAGCNAVLLDTKGGGLPPVKSAGTGRLSLAGTANPKPPGLCVLGSPLGTRALDTGNTATAHERPQKLLFELQRAHGKTRTSFPTVCFLPDSGDPSHAPMTPSSTPGHNRSLGSPQPTRRTAENTGGKTRTTFSGDVDRALCLPSHGTEAPAQSSAYENPSSPPPMLAYSNKLEGASTLQMYSNELHHCLRRPRAWDEG